MRITGPNHNREEAHVRINDHLKAGKLVGIGYDMAGVVSLSSGGHASSLAGIACIDNQEHYILRNSWGAQDCEDNKKNQTLKKLGSAIFNNKEKSELAANYNSCMDACSKMNINSTIKPQGFSLDFNDTRIDPTKKLLKLECQQTCYENNKKDLSQVVDTFYCDNGYYIIKSEKILNAIDSVSTIN